MLFWKIKNNVLVKIISKGEKKLKNTKQNKKQQNKKQQNNKKIKIKSKETKQNKKVTAC